MVDVTKRVVSVTKSISVNQIPREIMGPDVKAEVLNDLAENVATLLSM